MIHQSLRTFVFLQKHKILPSFLPLFLQKKSPQFTLQSCVLSYFFSTCFLSSDHCDGNLNQCRFLLQYHPPIRHIDHKGCHCTWPSDSGRKLQGVSLERQVKTTTHGNLRYPPQSYPKPQINKALSRDHYITIGFP